MKFSNPTDNAMLYKDVTQWLRNKTFLMLFLGLLATAEVICAIVVSVPTDPGEAGPIIFSFLAFLLFVYVLVIAFMGHGLTSREFANQTFELYEISGMSLERMVWGKLLSMLSQFLFGFFCIVPFLFFAFILGGLDFYLVLATVLAALVFTPPFYLAALAISFLTKKKTLATLGRGLGILGLLILMWWGSALVLSLVFRGRMGFNLSDFVKNLFTLNKDTLIGLGVFFGFYIQILLFLFYLCCNAISAATDSRETAVKVLFCTLAASWMTFFAVVMAYEGFEKEPSYIACIGFMIVVCVAGMLWYYNRLEIPVMARIRRERARRPWTRFAHFVFLPGPAGAVRTLLLLWLIVIAYWVFVFAFAGQWGPGHPADVRQLMASVSIPLAAPFFIAFPGCLLLGFKKIRSSPAAMRMIVLFWWVLIGLVLLILAMIALHGNAEFSAVTDGIIVFLAAALSPLSSPFTDTKSTYINAVPTVRIILGLCGIALLARTLRARRKKEAAP